MRAQDREALRVAAGRRIKGVSALRVRQSKPIELELNIEGYRLWMGGSVSSSQNLKSMSWRKRWRPTPRCAYTIGKGAAPTPILDGDRHIMAVLGGNPRDADWHADVAAPATARMEASGMNLAHSVVNAAIFARLFAYKEFECITGWTNALFMAFAPALHHFYGHTLDALLTGPDQPGRGAQEGAIEDGSRAERKGTVHEMAVKASAKAASARFRERNASFLADRQRALRDLKYSETHDQEASEERRERNLFLMKRRDAERAKAWAMAQAEAEDDAEWEREQAERAAYEAQGGVSAPRSCASIDGDPDCDTAHLDSFMPALD
ncbi:hypothetical protein FB451DRAFT_1411497 [Mycena latifolia]|nr:hypothetical protein FB451DRAFT_1411497 [Mycena latifolia]